MNRLALALALIGCGTSGWGVHAQTQPAPRKGPEEQPASYDAGSFYAELTKLSKSLGNKLSKDEMAALRDGLPREWQVSTPEGRYAISTQPLRNQLTKLKSEQAKEWLELLKAELAAYVSPNAVQDPPRARKELEKILSRQEYASVRGPNAWERFRERLAFWIAGEVIWRNARASNYRPDCFLDAVDYRSWVHRVVVVPISGVARPDRCARTEHHPDSFANLAGMAAAGARGGE